MNEKALKLFLENYENKGQAEGLQGFQKVIVKEFKKSNTTKHINYLPWAVVERIFRMQGGKIEVVSFNHKVEFEVNEYNPESGEIEKGIKSAMFVHLKGYWQDEELDEFYPIFDNQTSKVIRTPDAQQLNTSRQRGSVRLIARLSGIGLWVFEQQDDDFEDDTKVNIQTKEGDEVETKKKVVKGNKESKPKGAVKVESKEKENEAMNELLFGEDLGGKEEEEEEEDLLSMLTGKAVEPETKKEETPKITETKDFPKESEEHSTLLLEVKKFVKTHKEDIMKFRDSKGKELLSDLTYSELEELIATLK